MDKKKTEPIDSEDACEPECAPLKEAEALRVQHVVGFIGGSVGGPSNSQ
jgi:hypothetical protein